MSSFTGSAGDESFAAEDEVFSSQEEQNGPILPPPAEMEAEEGYALREWRRQNAIRLEEKEREEKEILKQIIEEAEEYKKEFHRKRQLTVENNKASNREKEKLFLESQEKFYAEAPANYWKAIAELIPREVPTVEKRGKKKEQDKKPSVVVIQGPKPGKPTDLSRMRHILLKLKQTPPPHMKPKPPPTAEEPAKDDNNNNNNKSDSAASPSVPAPGKAAAAATPQAAAAAN
ncbi:hypothetical protein Tsubulata_012836 [Turnera subulata]|uniref:Clathrin light chain n=1 Tax=Turnera subulata TaxID=218843 RepID=A0A9Q0FP77_9ROSI|nr:hypothetical protein Tsubulata_012836 [Turnera subulata]